MCTRGWRETDSETDWDFFWAEREWVYEAFDSTHLESWQRINHFRNGRELCRKDLLLKNLKRRKRQLEREGHHTEATAYEFFPVSFVLPREYAMFVEEFKRSGGVWIMKVRPPARALETPRVLLLPLLPRRSPHTPSFPSPAVRRGPGTRHISLHAAVGDQRLEDGLPRAAQRQREARRARGVREEERACCY